MVWFTVSEDFRETWQSHLVLCGENMRERLFTPQQTRTGAKNNLQRPTTSDQLLPFRLYFLKPPEFLQITPPA